MPKKKSSNEVYECTSCGATAKPGHKIIHTKGCVLANGARQLTAMRVLGITSIQNCTGCGHLWVNLNDRTCRLCGAGMTYVSDQEVTN